MSYKNVSVNHPLIENSQDYALIKKYVSIHSIDRDFLKYPNAALFEIELPEDMLNVSVVKLADYSFPLFYDLYSTHFDNVTMSFKISKPYNPASSALEIAILEALNANINNNYFITIENGTYSGSQLANELTNKMNEAVSLYIIDYFSTHGYDPLISLFTGYSAFVVNYNSVSGIMWFGNRSDEFILTNSTQVKLDLNLSTSCEPCETKPTNFTNIYTKSNNNCYANNRGLQPNFYDYGLPSYLGLTRCDTKSTQATNSRFYFENSAWLTPLYPSQNYVYYVSGINKTNLNTPVHFYLDIEGLNCIDETYPFALNKFTTTTNETSGKVNSAFAKIICAPVYNSWADKVPCYKYFMPPAERIRKIKLKLRYHNGYLVDFKGLQWSILLEFVLFQPQQIRKQNLYNPQAGIMGKIGQ
jgi:hypothetical protein